jgi:hypothetical protein
VKAKASGENENMKVMAKAINNGVIEMAYENIVMAK